MQTDNASKVLKKTPAASVATDDDTAQRVNGNKKRSAIPMNGDGGAPPTRSDMVDNRENDCPLAESVKKKRIYELH